MLQLPHCASINKLPEHDLLTYCFSLNAKNRHLKRQLIHSSVRGFAALDEFSEVWLGAESNRRHVDFQSTALPTELPSRDGADPVAPVGFSLCNNVVVGQALR